MLTPNLSQRNSMVASTWDSLAYTGTENSTQDWWLTIDTDSLTETRTLSNQDNINNFISNMVYFELTLFKKIDHHPNIHFFPLKFSITK